LKGAYVLLLSLNSKHLLIISSKRFELEAGAYAYVGSARGPGGVEARVHRHFSIFRGDPRKAHWHIDHLLPRASSLIAIAVEGDRASECYMVASLKTSGFAAVKGFGSTDCRTGCGGHLLKFAWGPATKGNAELSAKRASASIRETIEKLGFDWTEMRPAEKSQSTPMK